MIRSIRHIIHQNQSILPLAVFRIAFGVIMLASLIRFWQMDWLNAQYICPDFHFSYFGFDWLPDFSASAIYIIFFLCVVSIFFVLVGWKYRLATICFFITFSLLELIDQSYYLNHYYFISLVALLLTVLPAGKAISVDAYLSPNPSPTHVKNWNLILLQLTVGGLYFMAGIAKLNSEWLFEANPLKIWLPQFSHLPIVGSMMSETWMAYLFSWFGLLYDLLIPFLLLNKKTRTIAFNFVVTFHAISGILFPIGMFPFVMIACSLVFLPAKAYQRFFKLPILTAVFNPKPSSKIATCIVASVVLFFMFVFPFRYALYPGDVAWNEEGYRFSWRVMLNEKAGQCYFYVKDPNQPGQIEIDNSHYLNAFQEKQMSTQPDMILQFAHFLRDEYIKQGISHPEVRVKSWVNLNGRGSCQFIDPEVNLSLIEDSWKHKDWVLPYHDAPSLLTQKSIDRQK